MKQINIEDFFTADNEVTGIWFEPKIKGMRCGLEFLVTGKDTDENIAATERYDKLLNELEDLKDPIEKAQKAKELDARRVAEFVKSVRIADGCNVSFGGKKVEYTPEFVQQVFLKAPLIKAEVIKFVMDTTNFIKREKNA